MDSSCVVMVLSDVVWLVMGVLWVPEADVIVWLSLFHTLVDAGGGVVVVVRLTTTSVGGAVGDLVRGVLVVR